MRFVSNEQNVPQRALLQFPDDFPRVSGREEQLSGFNHNLAQFLPHRFPGLLCAQHGTAPDPLNFRLRHGKILTDCR
jgi:hypothetical protein